MKRLTRRGLKKAIDIPGVQRTIAEAEKRTSGEIRVCLSRYFWGSVQHAAEKAFDLMGMRETEQRNGILFFVVPSRKIFFILGDEGIHASVGQSFWEHLAEILSRHFSQGEYTQGLIEAIQEAGDKLSEHFPYDPDKDINELPDDIVVQ